MQTLDFAISDQFKFDARSGRFRYSSGAAKGQFASRAAVLNLTRQAIAAQTNELTGLADQLTNGAIDLRQFQTQAAELVRKLHVQSAVLGSGGTDRMTSEMWLEVARNLKIQYKNGVDENGRKFGLKHLTSELTAGTVTPAMLRHRLALYAQSAKLSYWTAYAASEGKPYAIRTLGQTDNSCPECVAYSRQRPRKIAQVPLPLTRCSCRVQCLCELVPLTLEEALAKGMSKP